LSTQFAANANRRFQLQKRSQLFIRTHNETLSVAAMCVCNPDRSLVAIDLRYTAPTRTGFAEIVSDYLGLSLSCHPLRLSLISIRAIDGARRSFAIPQRGRRFCRAIIPAATPNRIVYIAVLEFNPNPSAHVGQRAAGLVGETARNTRHRPAAVFVAYDIRHCCPDASKHLRVIDVGHRASVFSVIFSVHIIRLLASCALKSVTHKIHAQDGSRLVKHLSFRDINFQVQKTRSVFMASNNKSLCVAMCVRNPDRSPLESIAETQPPTPTGFAEIFRSFTDCS